MTPGIPSGSEVPDDAGVGGPDPGRRFAAVLWTAFVVLGVVSVVLLSGTVGASLVADDAEVGSPSLVVELDGTPTVAVAAGDVAVGVAVTDDGVHYLFGVTDLDLPPGDARSR